MADLWEETEGGNSNRSRGCTNSLSNCSMDLPSGTGSVLFLLSKLKPRTTFVRCCTALMQFFISWYSNTHLSVWPVWQNHYRVILGKGYILLWERELLVGVGIKFQNRLFKVVSGCRQLIHQDFKDVISDWKLCSLILALLRSRARTLHLDITKKKKKILKAELRKSIEKSRLFFFLSVSLKGISSSFSRVLFRYNIKMGLVTGVTSFYLFTSMSEFASKQILKVHSHSNPWKFLWYKFWFHCIFLSFKWNFNN